MSKSNPHLFKKTLLAIAVTTILSACGGGGSDNNDDTGGVTTIDATISGTAAKGIIINGNVVADELNADKSVKNANVGSATTDSDGKYTLELNDTYTGGPIKVTVSAGSSTTMVCDATSGCGTRTDDVTDANGNTTIDFGEQYKPSSLTMSALLPEAADGETISVQITPFTNMAAERALNQATLDASAINNANSEVSNLLGGIDILSTPPVDITDPASLNQASASAQVYAALTASIAELAPDDANGQPDIEQAMTTLSDDFADGTMPASDAADSDDVISMDEIVSAATGALDEVNASDTSGVLAELSDDVANAGEDGNIDPQPSSNAGDTNVAKAKAFLADLRTWGVTVGGQIDAPSAAFENQIEMADMAANMIQNDGAGDAIALGAMALVEYFQGTLTTLTDFSDAAGVSPFSGGTLSKTTNASGAVEYSITSAVVSVNGDSVNLDMTLVLPADGATGNVISFGVKSIISEGDPSKLVVNAGTIDVTLGADYSIDYDALNAGTAADPSAPNKVVFNFDFAATQKKTLDTDGVTVITASDPVSFAGTLSATIFPYVDSMGDVIDAVPGSFNATGAISNTSGDSYNVALSASIPNAATTTPVNTPMSTGSSYASNNGGEHLINWTYTDGGNSFNYTAPYFTYSASYTAPTDPTSQAEVAITEIYSDGIPSSYTAMTNAANLSEFLLTNFRPDDFTYSFGVEGQGYYARSFSFPDYSKDGFVEFTLEEPEVIFFDAENPLMGTMGMQFTAQFDGLPEASVSITGNATGFEKGNMTVAISFGNRSLNFSANNEAATGAQGTMTITNQDGVSMVVNGSEAAETLSVTINDVAVATISELANGSVRVDYIDGTFEIF